MATIYQNGFLTIEKLDKNTTSFYFPIVRQNDTVNTDDN